MMIVLIETRESVCQAYLSGFERLGVAIVDFEPAAFLEWLEGSSVEERYALQGIVVADVDLRDEIARVVSGRLSVPLVALTDQRSLKQTLALFSAGFDDVVGKPVHVQEILARISRLARRRVPQADVRQESEIIVFGDGRDPIVRGEVLVLPRRERRILECLYQSGSAWITKGQIFGRVYGVFNEDYDESVIESHICRLRRRLKLILGYDPVDSQRYLGYRLAVKGVNAEDLPIASLMQTPKSNLSRDLAIAGRR